MKVKITSCFTVPFNLFENEVRVFEKRAYKSAEMHYDEEGKPVQEIKYFEDGNVDERAEYQYDDQGRLIREELFFELGDETDSRVFEYNDASNSVQEIYYYGNDPGEKVETVRNGDGDLITEKKWDVDGQLESEREVTYFKAGLVELEKIVDQNSGVEHSLKHSYDSNDLLTLLEIRSNNPEISDEIHSIEREGNIRTLKVTDGDENKINTRIEELNGNGDVVRLTQLNEMDSIIFVLDQIYDDNKNMVSAEWKDAAGNLLKKNSFEYNEHNQVIEELFFERDAYSMDNNHHLTRFEFEYYT